jgi:hypothetical protein
MNFQELEILLFIQHDRKIGFARADKLITRRNPWSI